MKIIHTSDWHLGKRLEGKSRLPEQEQALDELLARVTELHADAVIVAGDVFDTVNPPAEAESLFYSACLKLGGICPVIAIAGNHDNPERLSAPSGIAGECGILLGGGLDYSSVRPPFEGGEGFVRLTRNGERVNFALLPYPSLARMSALGYAVDSQKSYADAVREWLSLCARGFTASDCNITISHLFMAGSVRASDEAELGTAALLPPDVLPDCHYTALGHVHKPQCVSKSRNVRYSGSLLRYSFDDTSDKFFSLLQTSPAGVSVQQIPVQSGKRLVTATATDFDACIAALKENEGAYVRLLYDCPQPLNASKYAELRAFESFASLKNIYMTPKAESAPRKMRTDRELFVDFYRGRTGKEPSDALTELFEKAMRGEEL